MKIPRFKHFLIIVTLIMLSVGMFSYISNSKAAFGTSPPWVKNDHMLPGTTFEQVINLSRSESDQAMQAKFKIGGDKNLVKWITIQDEENMIMKGGQTVLPVTVIIEVPKKAAIKDYNGNIYVTLSPVIEGDDLGGGQVAIALGGNIDVNISVVGDAVTDYWIKNAMVLPLSEGNAFGLRLEVQNLGNTQLEGIEGQIDIYDSKETEILHSINFPPFRFPIEPDKIDSPTMFFKEIKLPAGEYWLVTKAFKNGEVAYESRLFQKIEEKSIQVISPEDALAEKPLLPGSAETEAQENEDFMEEPPIEFEVNDLRPAAVADGTTSMFLIFGLAGLGFGLVALIGVIVVMIFVLKNQQKPIIASYPFQPQMPQPPQPIQPQPIQPQPIQPPQPVEPQPSTSPNQGTNIEIHAEGQE